MNDTELTDLLESYNQKLEEARVLNLQSWALNLQCFGTLQTQKAVSRLRRLANFKIAAMTLGVIWVLFLGYLLYFSIEIQKIFFAVSVAGLMVFGIIAIAVYGYHVVLISKINTSARVLETQERIGRLQVSTLKITRILFLQTPLYSTFFWNLKWIENDPASFWLIAFPVTVLFTLASLWLYRNISYKNAHKKWFRILFHSPEWTSLVQAQDFLTEIDNFKKNS